MNDLAQQLEAILQNQPRVTSEEFWRQVEEFRGSLSPREEPPKSEPSSNGLEDKVSSMPATI